MDANRSSANAAKRVRIRRSCVGVTGYHQRRWRTPFQLRGYHFTGTPSSSTFTRPNRVLLVAAFVIYQWQRHRKGLGVAVLTDRPLLSTPMPFTVTLHHDGKVVGKPRLIILRIANTGNVAIETADFVQPLSITFPGC